MNTGMPMPASSLIMRCMSAYICLALGLVSLRARIDQQFVELLVLPMALVPRARRLEEQRQQDVWQSAAD